MYVIIATNIIIKFTIKMVSIKIISGKNGTIIFLLCHYNYKLFSQRTKLRMRLFIRETNEKFS